MPDVVTVGPQASDQQLVAALMMGGFSNNNAIATMVQIAGWESDKTPKINSSPGESPAGYSGCKSVGVWQINYCPGRDKGTIREQVANNPNDLVLSARAAYQVSNGGTNFHPWTTWVQHNSGVNTQPSGNIPTNIGAGFVTTPLPSSRDTGILAPAIAGIKAAIGTGNAGTIGGAIGAVGGSAVSTVPNTTGGCTQPTGLNAVNPAAWMGFIYCKAQADLARGAEIVIGLILVIVALMIFAKMAGDKTGVTEIAKGAAIAAA